MIRYPDKANLPKGIALEEDSDIRDTALRVFFLRQAGYSDDEIAPMVHLKPITVSAYIYKAAKNGWLDEWLDSPKDQMEHRVFHKVVRRIEEALDSDAVLNTGMKERTAVALKVGDGSLFNNNAQTGVVAAPTTLIGVKIEIVGGAPQAMREGTVVGSGVYVEGEKVEP